MSNQKRIRLINHCTNPLVGDYYTPGIYEPNTLPDGLLNNRLARYEILEDELAIEEPKEEYKKQVTDCLVEIKPTVTAPLLEEPEKVVVDLNNKEVKVKTRTRKVKYEE